jgi:hypothetical protein
MPLNTTTPTLKNTLRKKLADPFDEEQRKSILGNNDALQSQIDTLSGSLGAFNADAERNARTNLLEQQAQQSRENIARTFALDPSGIKTGAAIRPFSAIEGARLGNLAALESELSLRGGQESRANLGALQGLQGQQQGLNLNAAQLGLQGLGALQNQVQFESGQAEQARQFDASQLGQIGGVDTLASRQLANQIGLGQRAQTESERAGAFARGATTRQIDLAEAAQSADINLRQQAQRLQEQVSLGNLNIDQANQLLNAEVQRGQLGLSQQQLAEQGRQFDIGQQFAQQQALGQIAGQDTLAGRAQSLAEAAQSSDAALRGRAQDLQEQVSLGNLGIAEATQALNAEIQRGQLGLAGAEFQQRGQQFAQTLEEQRLARQESNALQRLGLTGTDAGGETIALQQLRQQDTQFNAELGQRASEFARQFGLSEAELFGGGPSVTFKPEELETQRIGAAAGDPDFRPEFDIDGNGVFEFPDFIALASQSADLGNGIRQFVPEDGRRTLAQQQLDASSREAAQAFGIEETRLAEATRQFDEQFGQAKREFNSLTTGLVFNDDGSIKHKWGLNANGQPVPVPVTSLERDQFVEQKRQFNEKMNFDIDALAQKLDLDLQKLDAQELQTLLAFVGSIANTAGTVFGGNRNNPGQTDFSNVPTSGFNFSVGSGGGQTSGFRL